MVVVLYQYCTPLLIVCRGTIPYIPLDSSFDLDIMELFLQ
jgi:hypothetical protein